MSEITFKTFNELFDINVELVNFGIRDAQSYEIRIIPKFRIIANVSKEDLKQTIKDSCDVPSSSFTQFMKSVFKEYAYNKFVEKIEEINQKEN